MSFIRYLPGLWSGTVVTLQLFGITLLLSLPLGFLLAQVGMSRNKVVQVICKGYIWVLRGSPLVLQVVAVYFGLGRLGIPIDRFAAACVAFVLNYTAYLAEIFRGGIESIDRGQHEAAAVLGMTRTQTTLHIILPQALKRCIPAIGNEAIILIKDTALVYVIGISDLLRTATNFSIKSFDMSPLLVAAIFYLAMTFVLERGIAFVERRFAYYE